MQELIGSEKHEKQLAINEIVGTTYHFFGALASIFSKILSGRLSVRPGEMLMVLKLLPDGDDRQRYMEY